MAQVYFFVALVFLFLDFLQCYNLKLQKPIISPECELVGICDNVENYPTKLVKGLIDKLKSQNTIFNFEEAPLSMTTYRTDEYDDDYPTWIRNPHQRLGIYTDKIYYSNKISVWFKKNNKKPLNLCETKTQFVPPKSALDMNGNWKFIINDSEEPVQVFRIETCRTPMSRCSENIGFIPGYAGACIQNKVFREMFYVNETKEIARTYFEVPTCCSCSLLRKDNDK